MDILEEIKRAEKEADEIARNSEKNKAQIIEDAKSTASRILNMREKEAQQSKEKIILSGKEKTEAAKIKTIETGNLELKELEKKASRKKEKAIEKILETFENEIKC